MSENKMMELAERIEKQNERIKKIEEKIRQKENKKEDFSNLKKLEKQLEVESQKGKELDNIYKLDELEITKQVKVKAKQLALVAYKDKSCEIYKQMEQIAKTDENGLIEFDEQYLKELEQYFLNQDLENSNKELSGKELEEKAKEEGRVNLKEEKENEKKQEEEKNAVDKIQKDTGFKIISLVRIEDEDFSEEVIGHQTGYKNQYLALTDSGTYQLIGENSNGKMEINPDFLGATSAKTNEQPEYNEYGECCGSSQIDMIVRRKDGTTSNLGLDMNFGQICLYNRSTNEEITTSTCKPTQDEIDKRKLEDAKGKKVNLEKELESEKEEEQKDEDEEENEGEERVLGETRKHY